MWVVCMNVRCHVAAYMSRACIGGRSWCRHCVGLVTLVNRICSASSAAVLPYHFSVVYNSILPKPMQRLGT